MGLKTLKVGVLKRSKKMGIFAAFGRINAMHPHVWDFADAPLVNGRLLGPDGLRGVGAQISWILPLPCWSVTTARYCPSAKP